MKTRVLIVDDESAFRQIVKDALDDLTEISEAATGSEALNLIATLTPEIVLIDINLPDMSGYAVCEQVRVIHPDIRVVFISGSNTEETRQNAYAAGGDDFLPKPFRLIELRRKIELLQQIIADSARLKESLQTATDTAMTAISNSGEMGAVIGFIKRAMSCTDIESLLKVLISTFSQSFDLNVSAQIRTENEQKTLNSEGRSSPLEAEILFSLAQDSTRIFEYGRRLIINYPSITLQIKNLPADNSDFSGRIRDHAAIIAETTESCIQTILNNQKLSLQSKNAKLAIENMQTVVKELEAEYKTQQYNSCQLFDNLKLQIETSLYGLGLTNEQESYFIRLIDEAAQKATALYDAGFELDKKFTGITHDLGQLLIQDPTAQTCEEPAEQDDSNIIFF